MIVKVTPFVGVRMLGRRGIVSFKCVSDVVNDCVQIVHRLPTNTCKQRPPGVDSLSAGLRKILLMNFHEILGTDVPRDKGQLTGDGGDLCPDFLTENKKVWKPYNAADAGHVNFP